MLACGPNRARGGASMSLDRKNALAVVTGVVLAIAIAVVISVRSGETSVVELAATLWPGFAVGGVSLLVARHFWCRNRDGRRF